MFNEKLSTYELYTTPKGSVWQCDNANRIYLNFKGNILSFRINEFLYFRRKVKAVNIHEMIFNLSDDYDFEVIDSPQNELSLQLNLCDIIQLRDLLDGARFALELNSMLYQVLGSVSVI